MFSRLTGFVLKSSTRLATVLDNHRTLSGPSALYEIEISATVKTVGRRGFRKTGTDDLRKYDRFT